MTGATDIGDAACTDPRRGWALPGEMCPGPIVIGYGARRPCSFEVFVNHLGFGVYVAISGDYNRPRLLVSCMGKPLPGSRA
jgi:hypothetical protein